MVFISSISILNLDSPVSMEQSQSQKLIVPQLVNKFPLFKKLSGCCHVCNSPLVPILSQMNPVYIPCPHPSEFTYSVLIPSSHLRPSLPIGLFNYISHQNFVRIFYSSIHATYICLSHEFNSIQFMSSF